MCPAWRDNFATFQQWAQMSGYKDGMTVQLKPDATEINASTCTLVWKKQPLSLRKEQVFSFNGQSKSLLAWSEEYQIPLQTLIDRIEKYGWSIEKALTKPVPKRKKYPSVLSYNGFTGTLAEWSLVIGIDVKTLRARMQRGWSVEQTLTTPLDTRTSPRHRPSSYSYGGKEYPTLKSLCEEVGVSYRLVQSRLKLGWSIEDAVSKPLVDVFKDELTGRKFGRLTVECLDHVDPSKGNCRYWRCSCSCGAGKEVVVLGTYLKNGSVKSCGCLQKENLTKFRCAHSGTGTRLYRIWQVMKGRCFRKTHPSYKYYGQRGITVCEEWKDNFPAFRDWALANGYQDNLMIDRIDNNGSYTPDNCRWATFKTQANNTRHNHYLTFQGHTQTIAQWAAELDIPTDLISNRINRLGWPVEKALSTPVQEQEVYLEYKGESIKQTDLIQQKGLDREALRSRLRSGWSVEDAVDIPVKHHARTPVVYRGVEYRTLAELCRRLNLPYSLVANRLKVGATLEDAIEIPRGGSNTGGRRISTPSSLESSQDLILGVRGHTQTQLILNGVQKSIEEWSAELHIPVKTLRNRLKAGWSVEKTLTTPRKH